MASAERQMPGHVQAAYRDAVDNVVFLKPRGDPMTNAERQMPEHVTAAYRDVLDNILFLKRQRRVGARRSLRKQQIR